MRQEEWVDWVDEHNQVLMAVPRSRMRHERLCHRATYIFIEDDQGRLYVQRRTQSKDYCPGMLEACCGGVVQSGEAYGPSAYRELDAEMWLRDVELAAWGTFHCQTPDNQVWGALYSCRYEGPLTLQASEVESVVRMTPQAIREAASEFMPDSLVAFEQWLSRREQARSA